MTLSLYQAIERFRGDARTERNTTLSQFCGVSLDTTSRWKEKRLPTGSVLIKLWYLLEAVDLPVKELEKLQPEVRYLGRLYAFGILSTEEILVMLGLSEGTADYLWRALQGKLLPLAIRKKQVTLTMLKAQYGERLTEAKSQAAQSGPVVQRMSGRTVTRPIRPATPIGESKPLHIVMAASFIGGLRPLVEQIVNEGEESIAVLKNLVGEDEFYAALDGLKAMSSRRAHQFYKGGRA